MKLFGRKAGRDESRPALDYRRTRFAEGVGVVPATYQEQMRALYLRNPIAQRAVRLISEAVGDAPLSGDAALVALVAARSGGQALCATLATQLLLHGNAYVQLLRQPGGALELFALRPERVTVEPDAGGWPVAYRYTVGAESVRLLADDPQPQILHIKTFHPLDDHYGLGCLGAAAGAIALHNAAGAWNAALLDNAARPSGALVYEPGDGSTLSREQYARLQEEMAASFAGARNAGRPMLLEGGLRWQALSLTPADMDFAAMKAGAAREIACSFGVPPMLLGLPGDATYANYKEANRALWRQAILPLAGTILTGIAQGLAWAFDTSGLRVDLDRVTALSEDRARLWSQVTAADFLTRAEKRAMIGIAEPVA
ncbi:phage portal protein [Sphingomonas sp. RB3P16]|uniref:phage portal protein n=1 Tax=Parasphingomonas frigoris TaxID=3096163 RepID=UPI002FC90466